MSWWVYKCNSRNLPHQHHFGDWNDFFDQPAASEWGTTEKVPALAKLSRNDLILAYQTDRNELVGIAKVSKKSSSLDSHVHLKPICKVRATVRSLKLLDAQVAEIEAFKPGMVKALYDISEVEVLLAIESSRHRSTGPNPMSTV